MTPERLAEINRQRTHIRDAINSGDMPDQLSLLLAYAEVASDVTVEVRNHEASRELLYSTEHQLAAAQERIAALGAALITLVCHDCGDMFTETVGALLANDAVAPLAPMLCAGCGDEHRAALAGSQGGGGETRQDVACTETVHRVQEGADACVCGENRMELML